MDFFMMDDRWGRDCPRNMPTGYPAKIYGSTQFDWLKNGLLWEVISSGIGQTSGLTPEYNFAILNFDPTQADPTVTFQVIQNPRKSTTLTGAGVTSTLTTVKRSQLRN